MHKILFAILCCAMMVGVHAAQRCNWEEVARAGDARRVNFPLDEMDALVKVRGDRDVDAIALSQYLLKRAQQPLPLGHVTGNWRVQSIQLSSTFAWKYPFFKATITDLPGCGMRFAKTSGSQRRTGTLYPMQTGSQSLAFLGASTVNDDPVGNYDTGSDNRANTAGRLVRIGRDELLLMLDADGSSLELYYLRR